jgi:hypothetical protein
LTPDGDLVGPKTWIFRQRKVPKGGWLGRWTGLIPDEQEAQGPTFREQKDDKQMGSVRDLIRTATFSMDGVIGYRHTSFPTAEC